MNIRTFLPGDEVAQVSIYNEAAGELPKFKPASLDEVRRRLTGPEFDANARFYAIANGKPVAYATYQANGRVSFPWCRRGHESLADALFAHLLDSMRQRGHKRGFAAYRGDWAAQQEFFQRHGFRQVREMINYVMDLAEMPTPAARPSSAIEPLTEADLASLPELGRGVLRTLDPAELSATYLHNSRFPADSAFVLRSRTDGTPVAMGLVIANSAYANPKQLDAMMPCFRLGAFGAEGMTAKRVNGMFSFVAPDTRDISPLGLDLLGFAALKLEPTDVETLAAQVPSDAPHLVRFFKQYFRRQGSFPIYEREL